MLTVDYDRLGVRAGDRVLDLGCGAGRHAYEAMRRGALVTALDADGAEIKDVSSMMAAIDGAGHGMVANAVSLPFPSACFDRVIAAEVLEHISPDRAALSELVRVLRPGGTLAVTVPRWLPELVCWALSDEYHLVPGGHIRIYRRGVLAHRLEAAGVEPFSSHHAHALHTPYWWLKCLVGVGDDQHPLVRAYHAMLCWDITAATPLTRVPERLLNPVLGKSFVVYARKAA